MTHEQTLALALNYFNAWTDNDFETARSSLADHVSFQTPVNTYSSVDEFMDAVRFTRAMMTGVTLLAKFSNENESVLLYEMQLQSLGTLRIAEYLKIENEKITALWHIHDTLIFQGASFDKSNHGGK